ncbi:hypothetical protein [Streptomyces sp. NPDC004726]
MARSSSGLVAGLTATALAAVCFLAYQAQASVSDAKGKLGTPSAAPTSKSPQKTVDPQALPVNSGSGVRVVYGLAAKRVWLVDGQNKVSRTFEVMPSTVNPSPGSYSVTSRSGTIPGSDGQPIEHVVRFATVEKVSIGFSAAVNGSMKSPDPEKKTGGVRMTRADGNAMWKFAAIGSKIVVVP